jgi:sarcosine oxidase subunit alpha
MSESVTVKGSQRLPTRVGEVIDRRQVVQFTFAGKPYTAHPGDTIASALAANGVQLISRSFKYHRPRGLLCCAGHCPNCLVQIGNEPSVRACTRPVEEGMVVEPQNARPSLERDIMSLTQLGDRFLPVGFYYKTFIHPQRLWPVYERLLRGAAGLGKIDPQTMIPPGYHKQYLHLDLAVIGGGPAGMQAAVTAAQAGARVALFDENSQLGGHTRYVQDSDGGELPAMQAPPHNLMIYTDTTVLGWWEDNWLAAVSGQRLYKIRAQSVIVASGAMEQPLVFDNNDLPGIMLGSGVQRLVNLYAVKPGEKAVIVTANHQGWQVAAACLAAGITVAAVVDERPAQKDDLVQQLIDAGTAVYWHHTILRAAGSGRVQQAVIAPVDEQGQVNKDGQQNIACDLVALSVAWTPANGLLHQAGATIAYEPERAWFAVQHLPPGVFSAGRVNGTFSLQDNLEEGRVAGQKAAAYLGLAPPPADFEAEGRGQASTRVSSPGQGKRFVCFCEDVTDKDIKTAIAEGYDSIELLKRYSTISMGPCQGKMCSQNSIHICAELQQQTVNETGSTTARPPTAPLELGALAGQMMEPVRVTAVHNWHLARGAKMMVAGQWLRPEHYGDPVSEVFAVRRSVGLIDVSTLGKLKLTGKGVPDLLSRIYVNKWRRLEVGRVRYGLMCNDEGIIMDDGVTARVAELEWYMTTTSSGAAAVYEWIQWWVQSGWGQDVHVTNVSENRAAFNLAGPRSRAVLQQLADADLAQEALPYMHLRQVDLAGVPCRLLRIGFTGELSYEIHCPAAHGRLLWEAIMAAGEPYDIVPFGVEAQRVLRLEKAHIIVGQDTDALTDPFAANMAWLVKLDKEDFLGQRALARIAAGGVKQRLIGFKMPGQSIVPEEGLQIVQPNPAEPIGWQIIGWITSSRYSPTLDEVIGLCWLPAEVAARQGETFTIRRDDQLLTARVHHGPFHDPDGARLRM